MKKVEENLIPKSTQAYLDEIAENLQSSRAVVMVGAGFSKNAQRKKGSTSSAKFPDWKELGNIFYRKLYGDEKNDEGKYLNVAQLADKVERRFKRPTLDRILKKAIPDSAYDPSSLHKKLLMLPWADVFTTNYDTLLERSNDQKNYDIVKTPKDLRNANRPRLVKLHGTVGVDSCIITETDYKTYSDKFAAFENTFKQALLENTLCLIGFSADDPNFEQWIEWMHKNIERKNIPPIYMISLFDSVNSAQTKIQETQNVVLVNIFPSVQLENFDKNEIYYEVLDQTINKLNTHEIKNIASENSVYNSTTWLSDNKIELRRPKNSNPKQLPDLISEWKKQRLSYPGWIVVPEDRRKVLWFYTQEWIYFMDSESNIPDFEDFQFLYELHWRMEKCLCPIPRDQQEIFEAVIDKYCPLMDDALSIESTNVSPENMTGIDLSRDNVKQMLRELQIWMLRYYREEGLLEKWDNLYEKLQQHSDNINVEHKQRICYERVLYALFELDLLKIKRSLSEWEIDESLPYWSAKKAGLLAEIGTIDEAIKILEISLRNIRNQLDSASTSGNCSLASKESYIMFLLNYLRGSPVIRPRGDGKEQEEYKQLSREFLERWHKLKTYGCDPWHEFDYMKLILQRSPEKRSHGMTETRMFDIGAIRQSYFSSAGWNQEILISYSFLRFCEDIGLPFRIPGANLANKAVRGILMRISKSDPYWARATMVRLGDIETIDHVFNRISLYKLETKTIDGLIDQYLKSLRNSVSYIQSGNRFSKNNFGIVLAQVIPDILSRLCCKCSLKSKYKILDLLLDIYLSEHRGKYAKIHTLVGRLLNSFSVQERFRLIPKLLEFPILIDLGPGVSREFPNPFHFINVDKTMVEDIIISIPDAKINSLIKKMISTSEDERKWSTTTLIELYELDLLEANYESDLAQSLWNRVDEFGFPDATYYHKFAFLNFPHPEDIQPSKIFNDYIRSVPFPLVKRDEHGRKSFSITGGVISVIHDIINANKHNNNIEWSTSQVVDIFDRAVIWWDTDKEFLTDQDESFGFPSISDELRDRFTGLISVLVSVMQSHSNLDDVRTTTYKRLISELQDSHFPVVRLKCASLSVYPELINTVYQEIQNGLLSGTNEFVIDSMQAILILLKRYKTDIDKISFFRNLEILAQIILWQKKNHLTPALDFLLDLIKEFSWAFDRQIEEYTLIGLSHISDFTHVNTDDIDVFATELEIRKSAACLAYTLFEHYNREGESVPDVLHVWNEICVSENEFDEIKNQWIM